MFQCSSSSIFSGLDIALGISFIITTFIYHYHPYITSIIYKDKRLEDVLLNIKESVPGISKITIISTLGRTQCVDKKVIYINTLGCSDSEIIEKVLHEYAHILNINSVQHCDHFWNIYNDLMHLYLKSTRHKLNESH